MLENQQRSQTEALAAVRCSGWFGEILHIAQLTNRFLGGSGCEAVTATITPQTDTAYRERN